MPFPGPLDRDDLRMIADYMKVIAGGSTPQWDLAALEDHVATDPFVLWAWSLGSRPNGDEPLTPPITHEEFVQTFKEWAADGASCPTQ
jgi:hypothetical protein